VGDVGDDDAESSFFLSSASSLTSDISDALALLVSDCFSSGPLAVFWK
jgi:hypothetical protein